MHDADLRGWLEQRMERTRNRCPLPPEVQRRLLEKVVEAETLEQFLATHFLGAKRFSVEGAEGLLPLFELLLDRAVGHGVRNVVIGMAHRGRLNVLANVVGKPLRDIFAEFRDHAIVNAGGGDVKYHLGYSSDRETPDGVLVHLSLSFNPSHLEWIDTVVQGRVRAKQDRYHDGDRVRSVPVLVHGDAAFAGAGHRRRVAPDVRARGVRGRRDDPRHREQPGGVHDLARTTRARPPTAPARRGCSRSRSST